MKKSKNKKAVSLMLSYVILISIALGLSIAVFAFLKIIANVQQAPGCEPETSIIINNYSCDASSGTLSLTIKNNGIFSVDGFILEVGDDPDRAPITRLIPNGLEASFNGYYFFDEEGTANLMPLPPELEKTVVFTNKELRSDGSIGLVNFEYIKNIRIQPFVLGKDEKEKRVCSDAVIRQSFGDTECKILER